MPNPTSPPQAWLSNTQIGVAYDCARNWQGQYQIGVRPRGRAASYPMRVGTLGHLHVQHTLDPRPGLRWLDRVAAKQAEDDLYYDEDVDRAAGVAADRIVARLQAAHRVPARDAEGLLVERLVRVPWADLQHSLRFNVPNLVFHAFSGMEGRIDVVDIDGRTLDSTCGGQAERVSVTIRDFKFTQKAVGDALDPPGAGLDRQLAVYRVLVQSLGFDVESMVLTVVDARPMLTLDDYLADGSQLVRADGLSGIVARNVEAQVYLDAWNILEARRKRDKPTPKNLVKVREQLAADCAERDRHADTLRRIERVVDVPQSMSWNVAREIVIDAIHAMDSRLRDAEAGRYPANHRSHRQSPCNGWCPMRAACHAATGFADTRIRGDLTNPADQWMAFTAFENACRDMVDRGLYESRAQRHARVAAALARTAESTPASDVEPTC